MTKKIVLSCMAIGLSVAAMAQVRVGVKGGWNIANVTNTNSGGTDNSRALNSFHVGAIADFPLSEIISSSRVCSTPARVQKLKAAEPGDVAYFKSTTNPQYIEIPVNFVGKIPVGQNTKLFLGVGPYAAFGVAGKNKYESTVAGVHSNGESNIKWDDDTPEFRRPQPGL